MAMHTLRKTAYYSALVLLAVFSASEASHSAQEVSQGEVLLIPLESAKNLAVRWKDQVAPVWPCNDRHCALIAIPVDAEPGPTSAEVTWDQEEGARSRKHDFVVRKGDFQINRLKVAPNLTAPSAEELGRIAEEKKALELAYGPSTLAMAEQSFVLPTKGPLTSRFGNHREYNGETKSIHFGADLRANEKTVIRAANSGRVVLSRNFFFAGNLVLLDHGAGVFSSYSHLSQVSVKEGAVVKRGEKLGMAGSTGRVTGPHLHWGIRVNGVPVDPLNFLSVFNSRSVSQHRVSRGS
jgi:murein DD-endopeptidase MepM/ murein hydrolase activator NlpD